MDRMEEMKLTDLEAQIVVGFLAGCDRMGDALDAVVEYRERRAAVELVDAFNERYPRFSEYAEALANEGR